jgi:hypothetical protein
MDGGLIGALSGIAFINVSAVISVGIINARKIGKVEGKTDGIEKRLDSMDNSVSTMQTSFNSLSRRVNHLYLEEAEGCKPKKKRHKSRPGKPKRG